MLNAPVYMRLMGLAAGIAVIAGGVAVYRSGSPPPPKAVAGKAVSNKAVASRPAPPAPPVPEQAPAELPAPDQTASVPEPAPAPVVPAPPAAAPKQAEAPPQAEMPPQARAALIDRTPAPAPAPQRTGRLDLNSASVAELNGLRGAGRIGRRIAKFRPYRSPDDLLKKRVVSRSTYARIKDQVRVGRE